LDKLQNIRNEKMRSFIYELNYEYDKPQWLSTILKNPLECLICREDVNEYIETPCNHKFCLDCINSWYKRKSVCPYCRYDLSIIL